MKIALWGLFISIAAVFIGYTAFSYLPHRGIAWNNDDPSIVQPFSFEDIKEMVSSITSAKPITVAVLGTAGDGYTSGSLVDAIVVAHINPETETAYLISVPRDLWISDEQNQYKINEIIHNNAVSNGLAILESFTGFSIDGYGVVDLSMVETAVDWMGGIDITLDEPAVDWVSGYTLNAGSHHINGEDAVWLLRNRYNRQGDFFREANQQMIAGALWDTFFALSKEQKSEFLRTIVFTPDVLSGIHMDIAAVTPLLVSGGRQIQTIEGIVVSPATGLVTVDTMYPTGYETGVSVVLPTEGFGNYAAIRAYIQDQVNTNNTAP